MNSVKIVRIFSVLVPIAIILVFGLMSMNQSRRRALAEQNQAELQKQVTMLENMKRELESEPITNRVATAEATPAEQAAFLKSLRDYAAAAGVNLTRYSNLGYVRPPKDGPPTTPTGIRPIASTVHVTGPFTGVRQFAYSVLRSHRLMSVRSVTWKRLREGPTTELSFTLVRYVTNPAPARAAANQGQEPLGEPLR